jgi:hypothetical protein
MPEKVPQDLSGPTPRPVAGPVVPLTAFPTSSEGLLGGAKRAPHDPNTMAVKVLVNGEPPPTAPGRADNFAWPRAQPITENETVEPPRDAAAGAPRPAQPTAERRARQRPASTAQGRTNDAQPATTRPRPPPAR